MKKQSIYALMSAIALAGAVGLSACSSSKDDVGEVNPGYNQANGEVPVQFVFNVAAGSGHASTRQSAYATQANPVSDVNNFRGIEGAHVMCFTKDKPNSANNNFINSDAVTAGNAVAAKDFDMARVVAEQTLNTANSTRVLEMSLPIKTNTMVFYGKAITAQTGDYKDIYGHLDDNDGYGVNKDLAKTSFHLGKRLSDTDKAKLQEIESLMAAVLTCIMETHRGDDAVNKSTPVPTTGGNIYAFDIEAGFMPKMKWSELNTDGGKSPIEGFTDQELSPLELKLAKAYKEMTTIQTAELRNGSGPALIATITDLWTIVNSVRYALPTSKAEAVAKHLADRINTEIGKYFDGTVPNDGGPVKDVTIRQISALKDGLSNDIYWPSSAGEKPSAFDEIDEESEYTVVDLQTFPASFHLPQGATHLKFDTTTKLFSYAVNFNSSAAGGGTFTVDDYYYPAELLYFGNSPVRVSDEVHEAKDYPKTTGTWESDPWTNWSATGSEVATSTRSVAMINDINYGTALLKTQVIYPDDISESNPLYDNNKYIQKRDYNVDEDNHQIVPSAQSYFSLVGILVGGQYPRVGWNFLPALKPADNTTTPATPAERQGYIYDDEIVKDGDGKTKVPTQPNYTLVFDNYNSSGTQDKVYVALEFQNNLGFGFFGKDNLIPNGSNFYLIGELDPSGKTLTACTHDPLPPYQNPEVPRVFMQDHMTNVKFKIGQWSLQYAYLNIPDLRSSSVTLGLSVDLSWSQGIDFEEVVIGGNGQTPMPTPAPEEP